MTSRARLALAGYASAALLIFSVHLARRRRPVAPPGAARLEALWDPNAETLFCLLNLGPWGERDAAESQHPLRRECRARFAGRRASEPARRLAALAEPDGASIGVLAAALAPFPEPGWRGDYAASFLFPGPGGGEGARARAERLAAGAREFHGAGFAAFLAEREAEYDRCLGELRAGLPHEDPGRLLEDYFGYRAADGYRLAFSPMLPPDLGSGFVPVALREGSFLYQFIGPFAGAQGPRCADRRELHGLLIHDLAHAFVAKALVPRLGLFAGSERLLEPARRQLDPDGESGWPAVFDEYLTKAVEHRIALRLGDRRLADELLRDFQVAGFELLPYLSEAFAEYERERARYRDLEAFLPRLAERLAALAVERRPAPRPLGARWDFRGGAAVAESVDAGLALAAAGLRAGDTVRDAASLDALARYPRLARGETLRLRVLRGGVERDLTLGVAYEPRAAYRVPKN